MKSLIIFIMIHITPCLGEDETVLHCSAKPGCQLAHCDSVGPGWDKPGYNINDKLQTKEFPITCIHKNNAQSQIINNLLASVYDNNKDIGTIKSDLGDLKKNMSEKIERSEFYKLQSIIEKLQEELEDQRSANNEMRKAMAVMEKKLSSMEKSLVTTTQHVPNPTGTISTAPRLTPEPVDSFCNAVSGNICYSVVLYNVRNVSYSDAFKICEKNGRHLALIPDEESHKIVVDLIRRKMPDGPSWVYIWTGINFDPITGDVTPSNSFIEWFQDFPIKGIWMKSYTNVYLEVKLNPVEGQGMRNGRTWLKSHGVLCEQRI